LATYVHLLPSDLPDAGFMDMMTAVREPKPTEEVGSSTAATASS
jgi:hypothetical protein